MNIRQLRTKMSIAGLLLVVVMSKPADATVIPVSAWLGDGDANDSFGSVNGTLTGTTTFSAGQFGQAFEFDGGGLVTMANDAFASLAGGDVSIVAWVKTNQAGDYTAVMLQDSWMLYFDAAEDGVPAPLWDLDYNNRVSSGVDIRDGAWHHLASVFDGGTAKVYVDGVLQNSLARTLTTHGSNRNQFGGGFYDNYLGLLDEVAVYDVALQASDVSDIMISGITGILPPGIQDNPGLGGKVPPGLVNGLPKQAIAVPEPSTWVLLGLGILGLFWIRWPR